MISAPPERKRKHLSETASLELLVETASGPPPNLLEDYQWLRPETGERFGAIGTIACISGQISHAKALHTDYVV